VKLGVGENLDLASQLFQLLDLIWIAGTGFKIADYSLRPPFFAL
jgi:hypothetical protein